MLWRGWRVRVEGEGGGGRKRKRERERERESGNETDVKVSGYVYIVYAVERVEGKGRGGEIERDLLIGYIHVCH